MQKVSYRRFERLTADNRLQLCVLISIDDDAQANVAFDFDTDSDIQTALDVLAELDARCASHGLKGFKFGGNNDECEISFDALGDFPARVFHFSDRNAFDSAFAATLRFSEFLAYVLPDDDDAVTVSFDCPADLSKELDELAYSECRDLTSIFIEAIEKFVAANKNKIANSHDDDEQKK